MPDAVLADRRHREDERDDGCCIGFVDGVRSLMERLRHVVGSEIEWQPAPDEWFTGDVWFGEMAPPRTDAALNTLGVMFSPGARTAWHRHIEGQVLYFVHGAGVVADDQGDRIEAAAGDVVVIPPDTVHWHGAQQHSHAMHLSLTTGGPTEWLGRKVTDTDYLPSD